MRLPENPEKKDLLVLCDYVEEHTDLVSPRAYAGMEPMVGDLAITSVFGHYWAKGGAEPGPGQWGKLWAPLWEKLTHYTDDPDEPTRSYQTKRLAWEALLRALNGVSFPGLKWSGPASARGRRKRKNARQWTLGCNCVGPAGETLPWTCELGFVRSTNGLRWEWVRKPAENAPAWWRVKEVGQGVADSFRLAQGKVLDGFYFEKISL